MAFDNPCHTRKFFNAATISFVALPLGVNLESPRFFLPAAVGVE
jgi:hypothetical protein